MISGAKGCLIRTGAAENSCEGIKYWYCNALEEPSESCHCDKSISQISSKTDWRDTNNFYKS